MDKYMLITVTEREISTEKFPSLIKAQDAMLKEIKELGEVENPHIGDMYDEYEIKSFSAWSNANEDAKSDWKIVSLFDENAIATRADKIRAMTDREMATELIDMIANLCEDGIPSPNDALEWLQSPDEGDANR